MGVAEDPLAAARGIFNGLGISLLMWATAFLLTSPVRFLAF